ncbi:hypothetical protein [Neobacillus sp. PS3-40]|uniref:hypothetical protein n=1 Tax=Neobacillus sp. PS3-40 TaxID=3070679 RepID=UPI0027E09D93|nr:hypothetical protein [Neobacillus sp. PS3-40]WML43117.1 hypothetical protein RCG20_15080 [Neobacillus sp. PS3-40]
MKKYTVGDCVRQGFLAGRHFFVFVVDGGIDHNAPIEKIRDYLKEEILSNVQKGYKFESVVWSNKFKGFLVQVQKPMDF